MKYNYYNYEYWRSSGGENLGFAIIQVKQL